MTDDEVMLWRFVIESFGCIPRHLKERITAIEWIKVVAVHKRGRMGADRRDIGLARLGQQICAANGKETELDDFLPIKLWEKPEPTAEDLVAVLDRFSK